MEKTTKPAARTGVIRTILFIVLFAALFHLVSETLEDKRYRDYMAALYAEPRNAVDVLILGSSHTLNGVDAVRLGELCGVNANNFAQSGQVLPQTYYALREALRTQTPKLVVVDAYKTVQDSLIDSPATMHHTADNMRPGLPKLQMVYDLLPHGERAEYLFDVILYHTRWKELTDADCAPPDVSAGGTQVLHGSYQPYEGWEVLSEDVTAPPAAVEIEYLDKIVALCREKGVEVLLISVPFTTPEEDDLNRQAVLNGMAGYAAENGLPYLNLMHCTDEMGFDFRTDMADMYHVNEAGMAKVTDYLGAYLMEHYDFSVAPDRQS